MENEHRFRVYVCGGPHCAAAGQAALRRALEDALWDAGLDAEVEVRTSGCQSRCDAAANLTIWPGPHHYSRLTPAAIARIVAEHLKGGAPAEDLLHDP
jgi:(2Fe-2S) ferredoxin